MLSMYRYSFVAQGWFSGALSAPMQGAWWLPVKPMESKTATRTGGPDDDDGDDNELRWLMPLLALVVTIAVVFG